MNNVSTAVKNYLIPPSGVKLEHYIMDACIIIAMQIAYQVLTN